MGFVIAANKKYCSYFKAFANAHGLKYGDEWEGHKYTEWITDKHGEFKKSIGIDRYRPYTKEQGIEFVKFINKEVPKCFT